MSQRPSQEDVYRILASIEDLSDDLILVGGQALLVWAHRYRNTPELMEIGDEPLASKDIDFTGKREAAKEVARRLHGVHKPAKQFDPGINYAVVTYKDADGDEHRIDFIRVPIGIPDTLSDFLAAGLKATTQTGPKPAKFTVMHPYHVLRSRLMNLHRLDTHRGEHSQAQCTAAVFCQREFTRELLDSGDDGAKKARKSNERVFDYLFGDDTARLVLQGYGIDARAALLLDDKLGDAFCTKRYPKMLEQLKKKWRA